MGRYFQPDTENISIENVMTEHIANVETEHEQLLDNILKVE